MSKQLMTGDTRRSGANRSCSVKLVQVYSAQRVPPKRMFQQFDQAYIDSLRAGEPETQQHFAEYFTDLLVIKTRMVVRSAPLREDIVQETLRRTLTSLHSLKQPEKLGAYVFAVCENTTKEFFRKEGRDQGVPERVWEPADESDNAERHLVREELKTAVRGILASMPERDRAILRALFLEGKTRKEVCAELDVTGDYLRVMVHRAKAKFKSVLLGGAASLLAHLLS